MEFSDSFEINFKSSFLVLLEWRLKVLDPSASSHCLISYIRPLQPSNTYLTPFKFRTSHGGVRFPRSEAIPCG